jgi:hypothetical protein
MKQLLKLSLVFLFLFAASQIEAQVRFGPEVGLNLSKMTFSSSSGSMTTTNLTTFHAGLDVEFGITKDFFIQSGVLYSIKGTKFSVLGVEGQVNPNYIEVPIHLMYKFDIGGPKFLVLAGPYFAYGIGGKVKVASVTQDIQFGNKSSDDFKPLDYGLNLGLGVEMSGVQLTGRYSIGLTNLSPTTDVTEKNSVIEISLAYFIGK